MNQFDTPETDRVADLLRRAGFDLTAPAGNKTKNPDLRVDGRQRFWVEVKALADPEQIKAFELARQYLAPRIKEAPCAIDLYVCEQARYREFKLLHKLFLKSCYEQKWPSFVLLSDKYAHANIHSYELTFEPGRNVSILAYLDDNLQIVAPWQLDPPIFGQEFRLEPEGRQITLRRYSDEFLIGAHLYQHPSLTGLLGTSPSKGAGKSNSQARFRRDVPKANKQISEACKLEDLPGIVFLVGFASRTTFVSALLGDLMIAFPTGEARYGKNGVFRRHKNRHISAAYLLSGDHIYFLANPFARRPVENCIADAHVISVDDDGCVLGA